jgi:translation initiation factor 1 (eIF-1/SUI1)
MDIQDFENILKENENRLNEKYENIIHLHKRMRNGRKCMTYIQNFKLDKEESKNFLSNVQKTLNSSGSYKIDKKDEDFSSEKVYIFNGDHQNKIKEILISEYKIDPENIKFSG